MTPDVITRWLSFLESGDTTLLATRFDVTLAKPVACDAGETVSSTRIRALRAAGRGCGAGA